MRPAEEAMLLLLCRLGQAMRPLREAEYQQLAAALEQAHADESTEITESLLRACGISPEVSRRILALLDREEILRGYLAAAPEISVLTRISASFPQRLRSLGADCPSALFCKGDTALLSTRCISLVGSRRLYPRGKAFAARIGACAAREGFTLVSGGAVGADSVAQEACLAAGGRVVSFVPDALTNYPKRDRLLYCSDEGYEFPFSSARALRRNRFIHALGEKVFVAQCPQCAGGTWAGTQENLRRGLSPVYVLRDNTEGVRALIAGGAVPLAKFPASLDGLTPTQLSIFG